MVATTAREFYGAHTYDHAVDKEKLDNAFRWLNKAIEFEAEGPDSATKFRMAMKAALKAEGDGQGHIPATYP